MAARNHPRKLIRRAAVQQLIGSATAFKTRAQDRVISARRSPWSTKELPGIAVYADDDDVELKSHLSAPLELAREISMIIEAGFDTASVKPEQVEDALDDFSREIEFAMEADTTLGGTASWARLVKTELAVMEKGNDSIGVARLTYRTLYYDNMIDLNDGPLDDFTKADVTYSLGGPADAQPQAEDVVTLPAT